MENKKSGAVILFLRLAQNFSRTFLSAENPFIEIQRIGNKKETLFS
jgi:hypothetical protein